jgi:hypothetical protein
MTMPGVPPTTRAFHGLNGAEIRTRILQEVQQKLDGDTRLAGHLVFPVVTWAWSLELQAHPPSGVVGPTTEGPLKVETAGRVTLAGGTDLGAARGDVVLADPRGLGRPPEVVRPAEPFRGSALGPAAVERPRAAVSLPAAVEDRLGRLEALITRVLETQGARPPAAVVEPEGALPPAAQHPDVAMHTGTGLPITGGARPSPGAGLADSYGSGSSVGVVQTAEAATRVATYGMAHPPLTEGGVGPPDAVRREAGLPVPQMQQTAGGIVDLPAGSF